MCRTNTHLLDDFPSDQLVSLQQKQEKLPEPVPTLPMLPTGCGILLNLTLVGIFPTARWLTDPTMPPDVKEMFGGTPFFALGDYRVVELDIKDSKGYIQPVTFVVNSGVEGMEIGFYGGAFLRKPPYTCLARFENEGTMETTIVTKCCDWFQEFTCLEFFEDDDSDSSQPRRTQLESLLGVAVDFILEQADWQGLPQTLVEIKDKSPRAERKLARCRTPKRQTVNFTFE
jgi:hypothetical protein